MNYGVIPENMFERMALALGRVPIPVLDCLFSIMKARSLMAGVRLGVFQGLAAGSKSTAALAVELKLDERFLDMLLRNLVLCKYLAQSGYKYRLSQLARRTMVAGGAMEMFGYVLWNYEQWDMVATLEDAVRSGGGGEFHHTLEDPEAWANYQRGMLELARLEASILASKIAVPKEARSLLDVAGSHGLLGAAICRKHAPLRSTVLDLAPAIPHARTLAAQEHIDDIVEHRAGNLLEDEWGRHDVILLSNILHHFQPQQIAAILRRAAESLGTGGVLAIWELERPKPGSKVAMGDGVALYFALTSTAGAYHADEYAAWLKEAGFTGIQIRRPRLAPGKVLVTAHFNKGRT